MCGPSSAMKNLNATVQNFAKQTVSEAGTVFGNDNTVFNNIMNATAGIIAGGPNQMGITGPALDALNKQAEASGAALTRNVKGAATATGGNFAVDPGATKATTFQAEQEGAAGTAATKNQITQTSAEMGRQNYFAAVNAEEAAPSVFGTANQYNETAGTELNQAQISQQNMDTQSNWWKDPVMKMGAFAANFIPVVGPFISKGISAMKSNYDAGQASSQASMDSLGGWDSSGGGS